MSRQSTPSASQAGKGTRQEAQQRAFVEQRAIAILARFNSQLEPLECSDFRDLIFRTMHDAYIHKGQNTVITEENITTLYYLWDILNEIDHLKEFHAFPDKWRDEGLIE